MSSTVKDEMLLLKKELIKLVESLYGEKEQLKEIVSQLKKKNIVKDPYWELKISTFIGIVFCNCPKLIVPPHAAHNVECVQKFTKNVGLTEVSDIINEFEGNPKKN